MLGPISAAIAFVTFVLIIIEENLWARKCKALYSVKFVEIPIRSLRTEERLERIALELNLDANGSGTRYWVHGRSLFSSNGFSLHLGQALLLRDTRREHAFV